MILGVIIALGVLNAVSMSALERKRQFGVLLALGFPPKSVASLLVIEGALLGLSASLLGLLIGTLVTWPVVTYGLDVSQMVSEGMDVGGVVMDTQLYASWSPTTSIAATLISCLFTTLASVWPALRAANTPPLEAIHEPLS
jgi:ABC-type lipoprotein release transport system permease subunit